MLMDAHFNQLLSSVSMLPPSISSLVQPNVFWHTYVLKVHMLTHIVLHPQLFIHSIPSLEYITNYWGPHT